MAERPIIFSAPMVRAILAGKKTQTRRIVRSPHAQEADCWANLPPKDEGLWESGIFGEGGPVAHGEWVRCPYGAPGDRLWVRETWQHEDGSCDDHRCGNQGHIYYRATETYPESIRWRPAIFMQRWASRITLVVCDVRVQRLQEISAADAVAEGISPAIRNEAPAVERLRDAWDDINGVRAPWASNPWVWAITFERDTPKSGPGAARIEGHE